jgi:hypothetical protein
MSKAGFVVVACATLLWGAVALALSPQEKCDYARIAAWKKYQACIDGVLAKDAKAAITGPDVFAAFAKCRHKYFANWVKFNAYSPSTCVTARFTDNGDQTVTDNLTGLTWEKQDDAGGDHDKDNSYTWSAGSPYKEDGEAFINFLAPMNVVGFGGAHGWRMPTLAELQTIVRDFECKGDGFSPTCSCASIPCIDPALDSGNTASDGYWSATRNVPDPASAWIVDFINADVGPYNTEMSSFPVRAVRGGL